MRVETDANLVFDDTDERCKIDILPLHNEVIKVAIVQCYDKRRGGIQQYIGKFDDSNHSKSIEEIMDYGMGFERVVNKFKTGD